MTQHMKQTSEKKWSLGPCSQSQKSLGEGRYTERCCLSEGIHILTCKAGRNENDWSSNVVMILGHRFCEDFVGYEAVIPINISGILMNSGIIYMNNTVLIIILHTHIVKSVLSYFSSFDIRINRCATHSIKRKRTGR